jgi:hypothetical protein
MKEFTIPSNYRLAIFFWDKFDEGANWNKAIN